MVLWATGRGLEPARSRPAGSAAHDRRRAGAPPLRSHGRGFHQAACFRATASARLSQKEREGASGRARETQRAPESWRGDSGRHVGMWGYGATAARLTPDQKVGSLNLSALSLTLVPHWPWGGGGAAHAAALKQRAAPRAHHHPRKTLTPKPQALSPSALPIPRARWRPGGFETQLAIASQSTSSSG